MTPMMLQWQNCKERAGEALLLFHLGDFYEAFYEDARKMAAAVHVTLTQRQGVPMCGVPVHQVETYLDKLLACGIKVAIADQIPEEGGQGAGSLVRRAITRIVTPGTVMHSQLLQDKYNRYLAAIIEHEGRFGLAYLDVTTGEFQALGMTETELLDALHRIRPAECIGTARLFKSMAELENIPQTVCAETLFDPVRGRRVLEEHFSQEIHLEWAALRAAGALLRYVKEELTLSLEHVREIGVQTVPYMELDRATMRHLELVDASSEKGFTLLKLLDHTATPMGGRLLRQWIQKPLFCVSSIRARQGAIRALLARGDLVLLRSLLGVVRDIERLIARIAVRHTFPKDLLALGHSLVAIPAIDAKLEGLASSLIVEQQAALIDLSLLGQQLINSFQDPVPARVGEGELFRSGIYPELDELRHIARNGAQWMAEYQKNLREETGIKTLKVGYTRAFGYYIEVSRSKGDQLPASFQRRQTLVNSERFVTEELKQKEQEVLWAEERAKALEVELFEKLRQECAKEAVAIGRMARAIASIDVLVSLAITACECRFIEPVVDEGNLFLIRKGRHPVVEKCIGAVNFIPNDLELNGEHPQMILLTGPNMAGKSTYIRQVALIAILAHIGSYIPAESAHIGLIDKIFSRIGASDDVARGQSTFMVEMSETAHILRFATNRSLVILDEVGRGTSTYDGIAIAWSVAEFLLTAEGKRAKTLFATHYWELTRLASEYSSLHNAHMAVKEGDGGILFLRKLLPGGTNRSYGIHVAALAGLPSWVVTRAKEVLHQLQKEEEEEVLSN